MKRRTWADPSKVEPHAPVATKEVATCGTCGHIIGWSAEFDPVHAVRKPCANGCGASVRPFAIYCEPCDIEVEAAQERARQQRLGTYGKADQNEPVSIESRRRSNDDGENEVDPVRKARFNEAVAYIRDYAGDWDFILSLRTVPPQGKWGTKWFRLSDRQVEVVLKSKARDAERARERAERKASGIDLNVLPEGTTRYAVDNAEGEATFIRVDRVTDGKWAGWVFVKQVIGGMEERDFPRIGSQRPDDAYKGTFESLLRKVLADPVTAAQRYGLELGECSVCGRTLTDAESRAAGIGPKCAARYAA